MDRLANLKPVLEAASLAINEQDWKAFERLSERLRSLILDAAMWNDRSALERMHQRLLAFRSAMAARLDKNDPNQAAVSVLLRADAGLAAVATRMRPLGLPEMEGADHKSAADRVLSFLLSRRQATTTEIFQRTGFAQGTVSRLLTDLRARGLVVSKRVGKNNFSRLTPRGRVAAGEASSETAELLRSVTAGTKQLASEFASVMDSNATSKVAARSAIDRYVEAKSFFEEALLDRYLAAESTRSEALPPRNAFIVDEATFMRASPQKSERIDIKRFRRDIPPNYLSVPTKKPELFKVA